MSRPGGPRFGAGLRAKTLLFGGVPILLSIALVLGLVLWRLRAELVRSSLGQLQAELGRVAAEVERSNIECLTIVRTLALAEREGLFGDRAASSGLARSVLEANPQLTGVYFGYEPDADGHDDQAPAGGAAPPEALGAGGRFQPYWVRDRLDPARIRLEPLVDMESSYYYRAVKNRALGRRESEGIKPEQVAANSSRWTATREEALGREATTAMITEPYLYEGKLLIEQTAPILVDGRFVGIAGVDRALDSLEHFLFGLSPFRTARTTLISRRGRIIASTRDRGIDLKGKDADAIRRLTIKGDRVEDTPAGPLFLPAYLDDQGEPPHRLIDPVTGAESYSASTKLPSGGWTLILTVDEAEVLEPVRPALIQGAGLGLGGLAIVGAVLLGLSGSVARRVGAAGAVARRVAEGDLTVRPVADSGDEAGRLLGDLGGMVRDLGGLVGQVRSSGLELGGTANRISAAAGQQEEAVGQVATAVVEAAAAIDQISASSRELTRTVEEVAEAVLETADLAGRGRARHDAIGVVMRGLADSTEGIAGRFSDIRRNAETIGTVVTTIDRIAQRTNILSLNASIQAEQAGESGLGFSAVAREIRRLSDQTELATADIRRMVEEMQHAVASGVMAIDQFSQGVRREVDEAEQIGTQFQAILAGIEGLTPRFESLRESMVSQDQAAAQIQGAMASMTETSRSAKDSIGDLHLGAARLLAALDDLHDRVRRFRTAEDAGPDPIPDSNP